MLKAISRFSVRYPVSVLMIIAAIFLLGFLSLGQLGIDLFPNLHSPRLYIELVSGERPPEEMEEKFVDPVESLAIRQSGVLGVSSVSRVGVASVEVEYTWEKDMNEAFLDLSKALSTFNQDDDLEEINITQYDPNATPVMLVALQHRDEVALNELRLTAENYVRNELIRLEGIADVEVNGAEAFEVVVESNDYLLASYDLELSTLQARIEAYNQDVSGGSIVEMGKRYIVRGLSQLDQIRDLEELIVKMSGGTEESQGERVPVLLRDVAEVSYSLKEAENAVLFNGEACVGLSIYKEMSYNTVRAVDDLKEALASMEKALPGFVFTVVEDQGAYISSSIGEVSNSLIGGILLAVFVLFLFLRRLGPTFIVSMAIPISIIATFVLMYFADLSLNIMTLGGLALGAGMLVDNAIVVLENIFRNHEGGASGEDAAVEGTAQVGGAIVASTLTTIVVFIPIVYLRGASGELFKEQAFTVAFSLLASLLVAILVIPMLYARMYQRKNPFQKKKESLQIRGYGRFLERVLRQRYLVLLGAALLMAGGWFMLQDTGSEFLPTADSREFYVDMELPEGTQLERTAGAVTSMEAMIRELAGEELELIYSEIGPTSGLSSGGEALFDDQNMATLKVKLRPEAHGGAERLIDGLSAHFKDHPGMSVLFRQEESALSTILGTSSAPVVVELSGDDMEVLEELSQQVSAALDQIPGLRNVGTSVEGGAPEVVIAIDRYRAGLMNLDVSTLVNRVSEKLQGLDAGQMDMDGELTDITVRLQEISLDELEQLSVTVNNREVHLSEVADLELGSSPRAILHAKQKRVVEITADLEGEMPLDKVALAIENELQGIDMPPETQYRISGEEAMRKESMGSLSFALLLSLVLVYMVMAAQFESLVHPFTILLPIPLAVVGAVAIFWLQGKALSIMALIGIILLVGIAVNDSIILVDAINQFRRQGMKLKEAILAAGQRRIRPIVMTTLTTILALFPLTLGFGESASLRSPMAWAVIGGLISSTALTLLVIPCIYMVLASLGKGRETREESR